MVSRSQATCQTGWREALAASLVEVDELLELLGLRRSDIPDLAPHSTPFRLRVPRGFAALMRPRDPDDPLLRQVLPLGAEAREVAGFVTDPVDDAGAARGHGLLGKYQGRALLITTGACAIHCRYCFRRHYPYGHEARPEAALEAIETDTRLTEVILSGGDPLMLDDARLGALIARLAKMAHLRRLRIHSRLPVVLPERVTPELIARLAGTRLKPVLVIHANHANELSAASAAALAELRRAGVTLLNQSVLLRGVNDGVEALHALSERLFTCGVLPYYLHQLDPVRGAAHFEVGDEEARALIRALRAQLPGYLVPRLVRERPGAPFKLPLDAEPDGLPMARTAAG
ncbi:MAG: EF-P beta-lysylation protein EpmB [Chromatiaceae bacterium]|nr:EF-P beta-lysylation protein EpmB [Chromatiaceae bacterium]